MLARKVVYALQELVHGNGGAPDMAFGPSEADIVTLTFTVYAYFVRSGGVSAAVEGGGMANDAAALAQQPKEVGLEVAGVAYELQVTSYKVTSYKLQVS